eukprot:TRINITY_DN4414_c1_g3_i1.p1 TRINITY_DN4414_c1_g3~~TRINITY_DN4414_c1_g3_i1.p1  ORF type:complete len:220 (+),score=14.10 TRINITY_DN4414_c1_g3_i1:96-755(+)
METLPSQVMEEILSRLEDASDLCRFMATSRAMRSISKRIHSLRFYCSYSYLLASRKNPQVPPFRPWVSAMLLKLVDLKKLRFDMEESMQKLLYEDEDGDRSDCWLTDPNFVMEWLPHVSSSLISLSITDFWQQQCLLHFFNSVGFPLPALFDILSFLSFLLSLYLWLSDFVLYFSWLILWVAFSAISLTFCLLPWLVVRADGLRFALVVFHLSPILYVC